MIVSNSETVVIAAAPAVAFERAFVPAEMVRILRGWGPVPATNEVELLGPVAVGGFRRIHNADGSVLDEEILVHDPPRTHAYRLSGGFRGLAKLLVTEGRGEWTFTPIGPNHQTEVRWTYAFTLRSPLAWPLGILMVRVVFGKMQRGALERLRQGFAAKGFSE
jgi:hypothetical protein